MKIYKKALGVFLGGILLISTGPSLIPTTHAATLRPIYPVYYFSTDNQATELVVLLNKEPGIQTLKLPKEILIEENQTAKITYINNLKKKITAYVDNNNTVSINAKHITTTTTTANLTISEGQNITTDIKLKIYPNKNKQEYEQAIRATKPGNTDTINTHLASYQVADSNFGFDIGVGFLTSEEALKNANITSIDNNSSLTMVTMYFTQVFATLFDALQNNLTTIMHYLAYTNAKQEIITKYMEHIMTAEQQATFTAEINAAVHNTAPIQTKKAHAAERDRLIVR